MKLSQIIKAIILTGIFSWMLGINSSLVILGIYIVSLIMIPELEKKENEFQKDIKEGNNLEKWYIEYPWRAKYHQGLIDLKKWSKME